MIMIYAFRFLDQKQVNNPEVYMQQQLTKCAEKSLQVSGRVQALQVFNTS